MPAIDATHDPQRRSWVESANGHPDFPIQNLPIGVFSPTGLPPRGGIAIGDAILDLGVARESGLLTGPSGEAAQSAQASSLNAFLAAGAPSRAALRAALVDLLDARSPLRSKAQALPGLLHKATECTFHVPCAIGDYTDFFAGIHHATNAGRLFRPDNPLLPNYKYVPIAYHGRASSIRPSGTDVRRPNGQRKRGSETEPAFGPSRNLDYELELGIWIGPGNSLGTPIPIAEAGSHIAGFCLLNDWSARDIQGWEYQPLGPFLAKNFMTSVSPWIVTPEALAPFRIAQPPRPAGDPAPFDYLMDEDDQTSGALDITLEVFLTTPALAAKTLPPHKLSAGSTRHLYWTLAQLVAHHTSGGCNLMPGDLFGSGTISGPDSGTFGSLLEITEGGRHAIELASNETRRFLEDGDEVIFRAEARRDGFVPIGFGECRGKVIPPPSS